MMLRLRKQLLVKKESRCRSHPMMDDIPFRMGRFFVPDKCRHIQKDCLVGGRNQREEGGRNVGEVRCAFRKAQISGAGL